jgi:predicted secreted protein
VRVFVYLNRFLPNPPGGALVALTTAFAIYFVIWWIVLFAVLPWGVRSQAESGEVVPGSDPGAPKLPRLLVKVIWTTLISLAVLGLGFVVYKYRPAAFDSLPAWIGIKE